MALFKICRGNESNLPDTLTDGYAYFCTDTGNFYIDWADAEANVNRKHINAEYATKLRFKDENEEWVEIDPKDLHEMLGFEQVQADWEQNDPAASSYIVNRPFGLMPDLYSGTKTSTAVDGKTNLYQLSSGIGVDLEVGKTYELIWDGTSYSSVYRKVEFYSTANTNVEMALLGNANLLASFWTGQETVSVINDDYPSEAPFLFTDWNQLSSDGGTHTVIVRGSGDAALKKLDVKYLPDSVATQDFVIEQIENIDIDQVQVDWDQTDPTSFSYILNRPFGIIRDTVYQIECEFSHTTIGSTVYRTGTTSDETNPFYEFHRKMVAGETYYVIWDDTVYECLCTETSFDDRSGYPTVVKTIGNPALGNRYYTNFNMDGEDNGYPFLISGLFDLAIEPGMHKVVIQTNESIEKLDSKYLPDEAATKEYVQETLANVDLGQVQADWNETNSSQASFIKNKPWISRVTRHGSYNTITGRIVGDVIVPLEQTTFRFGYKYDSNDAVRIVGQEVENQLHQILIGQKYTITWDGVPYICEGRDLSVLSNDGNGFVGGTGTDYCVLGNATLYEGLGLGEDTKEPFCVIWSPVEPDGRPALLLYNEIYTSSRDLEHTISITPVNDVIKLDKKYLPDGLATEQFVEDKIANIKVSGGGTVEQQIDVMPETEFAPFEQNALFGGQYVHNFEWGESSFVPQIGESYTVVWEGVEYSCVAYDTSDTVAGSVSVGNGSIFGYSSNNEPFGMVFDEYGVTLVATDGSTDESHTIRIYQTKVSSAGGVSSWNDLTDKPFYDEEVVVFEGEFQGTKYDSDGDGVMDAWEDMMFAPYNNEDPLVVGQTYTFYWDGVKYTSECYSLMGVGAIGFNAITSEGMSAYPVAMGLDIGGMMTGGTPAWIAMHAIAPTDMSHSGLHSCKIITQETKKIDDKYQHQPDWDETDVNRASFVKNKPFGVLSKAGVLYESDVSYEANDFGFMLMDFASEDVIIGGNYKVSVNGVSYTGVCEGAGSLDDGAITYTHLVRLNADGYSTLELVCNPTLVEVGVTIPAALAPENLLDDTRWENGEVCHIVISAMDEIVATVPHKYLDFIERHEDVVIPKMDVEMWLEGGFLGTHIPATPEALQKVRSHDGGSIYVQYDGVEYKTKIYASNYFGDVSFVGAGVESTGEPYVMYHDVIDTQDVWVLVDLSGTSSDATSTITKSIKVWFDEQATIKHEFLDFIETTSGTETDVLAETTLEVFNTGTGPNGAVSLIGWPESLALDSTQSYFIVWDGATYECVPTALMDGFAMGDPYIYGGSSTTNGIPFLFMFGSASGTKNCLVTTDTTSTSHIVRIYRYAPGTSKIKEEYLPEIHAEPAELPHFNLIEMGLPNIPIDGSQISIECDTSAIREAVDSSTVKVTVSVAGVTMTGVGGFIYTHEHDNYTYSQVAVVDGVPAVVSVYVTATHIAGQITPLGGGATVTMTDVSQEGA